MGAVGWDVLQGAFHPASTGLGLTQITLSCPRKARERENVCALLRSLLENSCSPESGGRAASLGLLLLSVKSMEGK